MFWKIRKTKLLCLRNISFFKEGKELLHHSPLIHSANIVYITFEDQKNREKFNMVHQHMSKDQALCYPVKSWASIVSRIAKYPELTQNTSVNFFLIGKKLYLFTNKNIVDALRKAVKSLGEK